MRHTAVLPSAAILSALLLASMPGRAGAFTPLPGDLDLGYSIHVGGVHVLDAQAQIGMDGKGYRIGLQAATEGFLGRVASWKADVRAHGRMAEAGLPRPVEFRSVGAWQDSPRLTTVRYGDDGLPQVAVADPPPEQDREPVPEALRSDTVDPLSAIVAVLDAVADGRGCGGTVPVFDGRQRYDLVFTALGEEVLEPSELNRYAGPAQACTIAFRPVAGRWKQEQPRRDRDEEGARSGSRKPLTFWLASPNPGAPPIPVRLEAATSLGQLVLHLSRVATVQTAALPIPAAPSQN